MTEVRATMSLTLYANLDDAALAIIDAWAEEEGVTRSQALAWIVSRNHRAIQRMVGDALMDEAKALTDRGREPFPGAGSMLAYAHVTGGDE